MQVIVFKKKLVNNIFQGGPFSSFALLIVNYVDKISWGSAASILDSDELLRRSNYFYCNGGGEEQKPVLKRHNSMRIIRNNRETDYVSYKSWCVDFLDVNTQEYGKVIVEANFHCPFAATRYRDHTWVHVVYPLDFQKETHSSILTKRTILTLNWTVMRKEWVSTDVKSSC